MSKKTVEIYLKSLRVEENGEIKNEEGNNLLSVSLLYGEIPELHAIRKMKLGKNQKVLFNGYPEFEKLLFKTEVNFYVWFNIILTDFRKPKGFDKFLENLVKSVYNLTLGKISDLITNAILKIPTDATRKEITALLEKDKDKVILIGRNTLKIKTEDLPEPGKSKDFTFELKVPDDVYRIQLKPGDKRKNEGWKQIPTKILEKDELNGELVLNIRVLG